MNTTYSKLGKVVAATRFKDRVVEKTDNKITYVTKHIAMCNFPGSATPLKVNGSWPAENGGGDDWPYVVVPIHNGHPLFNAVYRHGRINQTFYYSRAIAELVLKRLAKKMYVSKSLAERVEKRMEQKYGRHYGRNNAYVDRHKYGIFSGGPFTPINQASAKPAFPVFCKICGSLISAKYIDANDIDLLDVWDNDLPGDGPYRVMAREKLLKIDTVSCKKTYCGEIISWLDNDHDLISAAKKLKVPVKRPLHTTLMTYPEETRGAFAASRFLDFEARYTTRANSVSNADARDQ